MGFVVERSLWRGPSMDIQQQGFTWLCLQTNIKMWVVFILKSCVGGSLRNGGASCVSTLWVGRQSCMILQKVLCLKRKVTSPFIYIYTLSHIWNPHKSLTLSTTKALIHYPTVLPKSFLLFFQYRYICSFHYKSWSSIKDLCWTHYSNRGSETHFWIEEQNYQFKEPL